MLPPWEWQVPEEKRGRRVRLSIVISTSVRPMFGRDPADIPGAVKLTRPKWIDFALPWENDVGLCYAYWR